MKRFAINILNFLLFSIILSVLLISSIIYLVGIDNFPALNFSNSYSFNEKALFLNKKSINPEIISIGSSMAQNNLHSEVVLKKLQTDKYVNTSSWAMQMKEDYNLLKLLNGIYDFKKVIIVSNIVDFQKSTSRTDLDFTKYYLTDDELGVLFSFLKNFSLSYYLKNIKMAKYVRNCANDYQYLKYDEYGMVRLKRNNFNINEQRWSTNHLDKKIAEIEYTYLDSISTFCIKNHLELYFFQSPYREGLFSEFNPGEMDILNTHINRVNSILDKKHFFVNSIGSIWNDSLFVDGIHFNELGAELFTKYCFDQIEEARAQNRVDGSASRN